MPRRKMCFIVMSLMIRRNNLLPKQAKVFYVYPPRNIVDNSLIAMIRDTIGMSRQNFSSELITHPDSLGDT